MMREMRWAIGERRWATGLLFCLSACSSSVPPQDPASTGVVKGTIAPRETIDLTREVVAKQAAYQAPRARVWQELHAAQEALGFERISADEQSGVASFQVANRLRTVANKPASRYIDCGQGPAGQRTDSYRLTLKTTHRLVATSDSSTTMQTTLQAWARNPGISSDPIGCTSLGVLETEINGIVATRLKQ